MAHCARDNEVIVLRQRLRDVMDRLAGCHPDAFPLEHNGMTAQLRHAYFKRNAGAERFALEDQSGALAEQRSGCLRRS